MSLSPELGGEKLPTRAEQVEKKHGLTNLAAELGPSNLNIKPSFTKGWSESVKQRSS
ncbi:hypothetical protein [Pseudomonas viridiflava]|uniref:hypothetical protein n=1 Tax=Pseudomonas viridiflava TaxID=33069 RepID=UPI001C31D1BC|nr:hypothetical protein [Pseudomonas viridiflava]MEE3926385.1 hypothetical protein [Pseudomonas viridiflava]MEE3932778.1 hypothetical protein [Pseudomonas viridiflava]MEE3939706.1 hypothetical protein [Pseudomonas viridiflava]MEE3969357.1 hypothetical protein [Pseudomonas viridiflava]MEE3983756.1 hypothetical protein [Pseudomonas viridiflava]